MLSRPPLVGNHLLGISLPVVLLAGLILAISDATPVWIALLFCALLFMAVIFFMGDTKTVFLFCFIMTCTIDITKKLASEGLQGLSISISDIFLFLFLIYWFFDKKIVRKEKIYFSTLHKVALIYLIWIWINALTSQYPLAGILPAITTIKYYLIFVALSDYIENPEHIRTILYAFGAGLALQLPMVIAQFVTKSRLELQGIKQTAIGVRLLFEQGGGIEAFRPLGFLGHPNELADYLVFILPTLFLLSFLGRRKIGRIPWLLCTSLFISGLLCLVVTLSRGGWLSLTVAFAVLFAAGYRKGIMSGRHLMALFSVILAIMVAIAVLYPTAYLRITERDEHSTESRMLLNDQALLIIKRNPLMGVGFGSYSLAAQRNIPVSFSHVSKAYQENLLKAVVHNKYLVVAAENGLIGLALFLTLLFAFLSAFFKVRQWPTPVYYCLALGLTCGIMGQLVFYLVDNCYADIPVELLWIFFGFLAALFKIQKRNSTNTVGAGNSLANDELNTFSAMHIPGHKIVPNQSLG
jgi:putative inorganic carbon (hco3(-)) transporter